MKKVEQNNTNHGNTALTSADELRLVGYLRAFDINGCPLSKFQTISFTRKLFFPDQLNWMGMVGTEGLRTSMLCRIM
jgi:hypothetical protein